MMRCLSVTPGLRDYARLGQAEYFCDVGMTIFNLWDRDTDDKNFGSTDLESLLNYHNYKKIYIALGINECGYPMSSIESEYQNLIAKLRKRQPEAYIVSQPIMTVGRDFAASADDFSISHLAEINEMFSSLADGQKVFYLDVNEAIADSEGYLPSNMPPLCGGKCRVGQVALRQRSPAARIIKIKQRRGSEHDTLRFDWAL